VEKWFDAPLNDFEPFKIESIHLLVMDDETEYSEWGVVFNGDTAKLIYISANWFASLL
jgi:hypothetical protein